MTERITTFTARSVTPTLLVLAIAVVGVGTARAEAENAPAGSGREDAQRVTTRDLRTCALLGNATLECWGGNVSGQLGLGDISARGDAAGEMGANLAPVALGDPLTPRPTTTPGLAVVAEGDSGQVIADVPMTLSSAAAVTITVDWTTPDVPLNPTIARSGLDYPAASGTVTFAPGESVKHLPITVLGDTIDEPPALYGEWGVVALSNPTNATLDTSFFGLGIVVIIDDD